MIWLFLTNLAWIVFLLWYFNSTEDPSISQVTDLVTTTIKETVNGIHSNLYPRNPDGASPIRPATPDARHDGSLPDTENFDDIAPPWESPEAYFGFPTQVNPEPESDTNITTYYGFPPEPDTNTDKWTSFPVTE